jgi:uncharacterized protein YciI
MILGGALQSAVPEGLLIFRTADQAAVEAFAIADPYVVHKVVKSWSAVPWAVVVGETAPASSL